MAWPALLIALIVAVHLPISALPTQLPTLVLASDESISQTHSRFLASLTAAGAYLDVRSSSNSSIQLQHWDTWLYSNVILLHPNATGDSLMIESRPAACQHGLHASVG